MNIDKIQKTFFKKSFSVGKHNIKYTWMQLMLIILSCIRSMESFEEGANSPSPQTLRDRLLLDGEWLDYFHKGVWKIAKRLIKYYQRAKWSISLDETYVPFFGNRKKLNEELIAKGLGKLIHGYKAKTPGATGSFCFLVISLCCWRIRLPIAIKMFKVGEPYQFWLEPLLKRSLQIIPKARILADRGFGKATWYYQMLEKLNAKYVTRIPVRAKKIKKKIAQGKTHFQYWMTNSETNEKVLLTIRVVTDAKNRMYVFATSENQESLKQILVDYLERWGIENIFKDSNRVLLPTSSRNPLMRLFCVVTSFFLFVLWQLKRLKYTWRISLKSFVKQLISQLCKLINCVLTPLGRLVEQPP
jgi:hypothetical protein